MRTKNPEMRDSSWYERLPKWLKANLFNTPFNSVVSVFLIAFIAKFVSAFFNWLLLDAVWEGSAKTCRMAEGACHVFLFEKARFILLGFYPIPEQWRPITFVILFCALGFYSRLPTRWSMRLLFSWLGMLLFSILLMRGGFLGLTLVETAEWGGLPLTLLLASIGMLFAYPLGILLALARRSSLPVLRSLAVGYIELIRGVPLISLLFMSSVMFPLFLPQGVVIDKLLRAQIAIIMFVCAYMAEVVRGGLQAVPRGQYEAAMSIGLTHVQALRLVILPQALKLVIPPTVNTAIGMFKDTSLVIIIALFDLMYTTKASMKDTEWLGFSLEAYLFAGVIYFIFCAFMSRTSRRLEESLKPGHSR